MDNASKKWIGSNTIIMMILFLVIFAALGSFIGFVINLITPSFQWYFGTLAVLAIGAIVVVCEIFAIKSAVEKIESESQKISGQYPELEAMVADLSAKAGIEKPSITVIHSKEPNACTLGFKNKSAIMVNDSLLDLLNRDELEGVIAHEISHTKDSDCFTTVLTSRLGNVTSAFSKYLGISLLVGGAAISKITLGTMGRSLGAGIPGLIIACLQLLFLALGLGMLLVGAVLCIFYPLAMILKFAISRDREFMADKSAAYLTKKPRALADALSKITNTPIPEREINDRYMDSMIINHHCNSFANGMMRTHPDTNERIKRLLDLEASMIANGDIIM